MQMDTNLDPSSSRLLDDLTATLRRSMSSASAERKSLLERKMELSRANQNLEDENRKLMLEIDSLKAGLAAPMQSINASQASVGHRETDLPPGFFLNRTIKIHDAPVHSVVMNPDSTCFATASWDATVRFYDFALCSVSKTFGTSNTGDTPSGGDAMAGLYSLAFAKTQPKILGCTSCDKNVYLWDCDKNEKVRTLIGHTDEVNGIDFHSFQNVMCTVSDDKTAIIWDFMEGIVLRKLDKHDNAVYGATFLGHREENQYLVATCCFDKKTRIFDLRNKKVVATLVNHTDDVIGIDFSPALSMLATGSDDGLIITYDARTWTQQHTINTRKVPGLNENPNEVKRVRFSNSGTQLAAGCSSGCVLVYDIAHQSNADPRPEKLDGHTDCVFDVAWGTCQSTGQVMLVTASHDHSCRYWQVA